MLKDAFIGRIPSHFNINPFVKAFIISEMLLWSANNLFNPILAIFVIAQVQGAQVENAALGFSIYLVSRVIVEIISGKIVSGYPESKRFVIIILGLITLSVSYFLFSVSTSVIFLYLSFMLMGLGLGISTPARMSIFSKHLDKDRESQEWSIFDATSLMGMALAGALGGFIANKYGFTVLFQIASVMNLLSILPYLSFIRKP